MNSFKMSSEKNYRFLVDGKDNYEYQVDVREAYDSSTNTKHMIEMIWISNYGKHKYILDNQGITSKISSLDFPHLHNMNKIVSCLITLYFAALHDNIHHVSVHPDLTIWKLWHNDEWKELVNDNIEELVYKTIDIPYDRSVHFPLSFTAQMINNDKQHNVTFLFNDFYLFLLSLINPSLKEQLYDWLLYADCEDLISESLDKVTARLYSELKNKNLVLRQDLTKTRLELASEKTRHAKLENKLFNEVSDLFNEVSALKKENDKLRSSLEKCPVKTIESYEKKLAAKNKYIETLTNRILQNDNELYVTKLDIELKEANDYIDKLEKEYSDICEIMDKRELEFQKLLAEIKFQYTQKLYLEQQNHTQQLKYYKLTIDEIKKGLQQMKK